MDTDTYKKKSPSPRQILLLAANLIVIVCVVWSQTKFYLFRGDGNMQIGGLKTFRYFTNDSNIFHAAASLVLLVWQIRTRLEQEDLPYGLRLLYYVATASVTVTLMTVLLFLVYGILYVYQVVFAGNWPDFYGFNARGRWFISLPVMLAATCLIGLALRLSEQRLSRK